MKTYFSRVLSYYNRDNNFKSSVRNPLRFTQQWRIVGPASTFTVRPFVDLGAIRESLQEISNPCVSQVNALSASCINFQNVVMNDLFALQSPDSKLIGLQVTLLLKDTILSGSVLSSRSKNLLKHLKSDVCN